MRLFRSYSTICFLLTSSIFCSAQQSGNIDVRRGVSPFFPGSVRSQLDSSYKLLPAGEIDFNGHIETNFSLQPDTAKPCILEGVSFKSVLLTYVADTLIRVSIFSIYLPSHSPDFRKKARSDYRRLAFVFTTQWKRSGSPRIFTQSPDKIIISRGLQWDTERTRTKLALYEDKGQRQPLSDISVTWELQGYD